MSVYKPLTVTERKLEDPKPIKEIFIKEKKVTVGKNNSMSNRKERRQQKVEEQVDTSLHPSWEAKRKQKSLAKFEGLESVTNCTLFFVGSEKSTVFFSSFCINLSGVFKTSSLSSWMNDSSISIALTNNVLSMYGLPNSSLLKLIIEQNPSDEDTMSNSPSADLIKIINL
uniref:Uncharacterized protein n=1 Tax=Sipha flava TaxID=143950 RepID=A0A2S2Q904_9HEMI